MSEEEQHRDRGLVLRAQDENVDLEGPIDGRAIVVEPEVLDDIAERIETRVVTAIEERYHSGPLPEPATLAHYEQVIPGLGTIIVQQMQDNNKRANKEQEHRHRMDERAISISEKVALSEIKTTRIGQVSAIALVVLLLALAIYLIRSGYSTEGFITLAVTVGGIIASQILPKRGTSLPSNPPPPSKTEEKQN